MTVPVRVRLCLVLTGLMWSATVAHAQFLSERLVPPQSVPVPSLPATQQPAPARVFGTEKPNLHIWPFPFSSFPGSPTALSLEALPTNWHRPVVDVPLLASQSVPTSPADPRLPVAPRAYVASADPLQSPTLNRFPLPAETAARPADDPSAGPAFAMLTMAVPLATPNPAPLLRLSIPDPFEQLRIIRLATPPADSDDPAASLERPALPKLLAVEPPK